LSHSKLFNSFVIIRVYECILPSIQQSNDRKLFVQNGNTKIIINIFLHSPWTQSAFCELNKLGNNTFNYIRNEIGNIFIRSESKHKPI